LAARLGMAGSPGAFAAMLVAFFLMVNKPALWA
jgi:hypothetical protein